MRTYDKVQVSLRVPHVRKCNESSGMPNNIGTTIMFTQRGMYALLWYLRKTREINMLILKYVDRRALGSPKEGREGPGVRKTAPEPCKSTSLSSDKVA